MGYTPSASKELAYTGVAGILGYTATQMMAFAIILVLVGTMLALLRLLPRIAVEPYQGRDGKYRRRMTYNGHPIGRRRHRK